MNSKHLLVKAITLLNHENHIPTAKMMSNTLVSNILDTIKLPEVSMGMDLERNVIQHLMATIRKMILESSQEGIPVDVLKQQLMIDCADDTVTYQAAICGLDDNLDEEGRQIIIKNIRKTLYQYLRDEKAKSLVIDCAKELRFEKDDVVDLSKVLLKLVNDLEPYTISYIHSDPGVVTSFNLDDGEKLNAIFDKVKVRSEGLGGYRFPWQDWNRMFKGQIESGKTMVIGALQHQHKSGTFRNIIRGFAMYNIPVVTQWLEGKKQVKHEDVKYVPYEFPITDEDDSIVGYEIVQFTEEDYKTMHDRILKEEVLSEDYHNSKKSNIANRPPFPFTKPKDDHDLEGKIQYKNALDNGFNGSLEYWQDVVSGRVAQPDGKEFLDRERFVYYLDPYSQRHVPVIALKDPFYGRKPLLKPAIVHISTEDEIEDTMEGYYRSIYFNVEGKAPDISEITPSQMQEYIQFHLSRNGWNVFFYRVNPSEWTYMNVCQVSLDLESKGYKVYIKGVDYYPMIPTTGCTDGPMGYALRDMYRRGRNFHSARDEFFLTPHQLSSDAMRLVRMGVEDFVKKLPDKNYYADSTQISHEVDAEIFLHIEKVNGTSWLTCQRGKYRSPKVVDEKHKFTAMPFHPEGGLQDDLLRSRITRNSVGGNLDSEGNDEAAIWNFG